MPRAPKKGPRLDIAGAVFGHIPGIPVGKRWATRKDCAADHVHPGWIAGIYGRKGDGARSVVLAGSEYEDVDNGDTFTYIGSGGRAPGVRFGPQTEDQTMENNLNTALKMSALRKKPVRVIRGAGNSKFAPSSGFRYDGLYIVSNPRIEDGPNGFKVCKFDFTRCTNQDPLPSNRDEVPFDCSDIAVRRREHQLTKRSRQDRAASSGPSTSGSSKSSAEAADSDDGNWEEEDMESLFQSLDIIADELDPVSLELENLKRRNTGKDVQHERRELLLVIGRRVMEVARAKAAAGESKRAWRRQLWEYVGTKLPTDKVMEWEKLESIYTKYEKRHSRTARAAAA